MAMITNMEKLTLKVGRFIPMPGGESLTGRVGRAEEYLTAMSSEMEDMLDRISLLIRRMESRIIRLEDLLAAMQTETDASSDSGASATAVYKEGHE